MSEAVLEDNLLKKLQTQKYTYVEIKDYEELEKNFKIQIELFNKDNRELLRDEIKDLEEDSLRTTEEGIVAAQKGMAARCSRAYILSQSQFPILFIFGKHDTRIPIELGISLATLPKYAEVIMLGNASHMGHIEERKYLKSRIYNFLNSCYSI